MSVSTLAVLHTVFICYLDVVNCFLKGTVSIVSGFFAERYSSLAGCFPPLDLPKEVAAKWPLQASAGTLVDKRVL